MVGAITLSLCIAITLSLCIAITLSLCFSRCLPSSLPPSLTRTGAEKHQSEMNHGSNYDSYTINSCPREDLPSPGRRRGV